MPATPSKLSNLVSRVPTSEDLVGAFFSFFSPLKFWSVHFSRYFSLIESYSKVGYAPRSNNHSIFNYSKHLFKTILFDNVWGNSDSENMYLSPPSWTKKNFLLLILTSIAFVSSGQLKSFESKIKNPKMLLYNVHTCHINFAAQQNNLTDLPLAPK